MHSFFYGWRRKAGCVTLLMACVVTGFWIRSRFVRDAASFGLQHRQQAIFSLDGRLTWWSYRLTAPDSPYHQMSSATFESARLPEILRSIETTRSLLIANNGLSEWTVPYWALATPLTLISVYLILWKPRKRADGIMPFMRRNGVRVTIGILIAAGLYGIFTVWLPYQREQRIARKIRSYEHNAEFAYFGPPWIPVSIRDALPLFDRIRLVKLAADSKVAAELLPEIKSLAHLEELILFDTETSDGELQYLSGLARLRVLFLNETQVTGAGLTHLRKLTKLEWLDLNDTQTTDAGIEQLRLMTKLERLHLGNTLITDHGLDALKVLVSLRELSLAGTQTTPEGRASLRKALPNCKITPDP